MNYPYTHDAKCACTCAVRREILYDEGILHQNNLPTDVYLIKTRTVNRGQHSIVMEIVVFIFFIGGKRREIFNRCILHSKEKDLAIA